MNGRATRWWWVLVAVAATLCTTVSSAQVRSGVALATCVRAAAPGLTPRDLFAHPAEFDCVRAQAGRPSGNYWVLSASLPAALPTALSVRTASVWQQRVTLYVLYADGAIRHTGFTSATTAPLLRLGAIIEVPLPRHDGAVARRLLWHVEGAGAMRGVVVGPHLAAPATWAGDDMAMVAIYAAVAGMVLALLLYNLALWGALRQRFQPVYCAMLACLLLYTASSSGWIGEVTGIDNNMRLRLNSVALATAAASAVIFARAFFERPVFAGRLGVLAWVVVALLLSSTAAFALLAPWQIARLDLAISASYVLLLILVAAVLWRARRVGSRYLGLFALAWGAPIALAGIRVAAALNLIGWHWWVDNSTVPALALEACLSGFAIAARIRLISRERDEARRQEILARMLADVDPLTGLLNRRAFLSQAIGRTDAQMLVIIDIDHFKRVNETIGHDGGDEVLRVVARALQGDHGPETLVARMGGEEFAILAPVAVAPPPATILERLRSARMPYDLTVTASIGSCNGPLLCETDWKSLYRCADRALFEAKAAGRDRVRHAPGLACAA